MATIVRFDLAYFLKAVNGVFREGPSNASAGTCPSWVFRHKNDLFLVFSSAMG
jgi:hypothetical protein